jgi:hypothetical protein
MPAARESGTDSAIVTNRHTLWGEQFFLFVAILLN